MRTPATVRIQSDGDTEIYYKRRLQSTFMYYGYYWSFETKKQKNYKKGTLLRIGIIGINFRECWFITNNIISKWHCILEK